MSRTVRFRNISGFTAGEFPGMCPAMFPFFRLGSNSICKFHHNMTDIIFTVVLSGIVKTGMTLFKTLSAYLEPCRFVISIIPLRSLHR